MKTSVDGNAIIYCEGAFNTPNGKMAHGLVRHSQRYRVLSVVDSDCAARDAGEVLDGTKNGIPILPSVDAAVELAKAHRMTEASHLVVGLAPDGGRLTPTAQKDVRRAIKLGLNVDSGLHDFLTEDRELVDLARWYGVVLRDVRKSPPRSQLHFFSGKIEEVTSLKVAVLGTDSAVGKRTTAWLLVQSLRKAGHSAELVGTGQTAWMQGASYCVLMDSLINDFVSGEIEHAVWSCWSDFGPEVIIIEGQGSLMNPAYPGGFEILAAARPEIVVLQHAPGRVDYDGFPGYRIEPLDRQIQAIEVVSGKPVVALTVNHGGIPPDRVGELCGEIRVENGLPAFDVLLEGAEGLADVVASHLGGSSQSGDRTAVSNSVS